MMSWRKDLKSQPKKGRYFPIRFSDAVRLVKDLALVQADNDRLAIKMENIDGEFEYGHLLISIVPEEDVAIYSLPENIASGIAEKVSIQAFKELAKIPKRANNFDSSQYSYFCAYLNEASEIILTRKDMTKQKAKYRGDSKFSNAFKSKVTKSNETLLSSIKI